MRRIYHFTEDGDTSGFFPALAKYHDRQRYQMTFASLKAMEPGLQGFMRDQGVATFSCNARSRLGYPVAFFRLLRRLLQVPADVFHAHLFDPAVVGLSAAWLRRVPVRVLTRHYSNYHTRINRPFHVKLDQLCTALASRVIAVSGDTAAHLVDVEGAPRTKVSVVHNGIDFERVRPSSSSSRASVRRELGLEREFVFLIAARLHPEKGYEYLFEATRLLMRQRPEPFVVLVAGRGPQQPHYEALARDLGIAERVRFLGFRRDLPDLMVASDVFVLPSLAEAFGLVLAEALYLGVPVLSTRVGGIPEIVDDGVDGLLVPPGDASALRIGMERFLTGKVSLPGTGAAAVKKVGRSFSFEKMLLGYERVYDQAFGDVKPPSSS
jgi:glycosyltransferase involved in cell wall biosynthesis